MPNTNCFAIRPGSIFATSDGVFKVVGNHTLDQKLFTRRVDNPKITKVFRYRAGQEINLRWKPTEHRN
jgi:hypothetical protein